MDRIKVVDQSSVQELLDSGAPLEDLAKAVEEFAARNRFFKRMLFHIKSMEEESRDRLIRGIEENPEEKVVIVSRENRGMFADRRLVLHLLKRELQINLGEEEEEEKEGKTVQDWMNSDDPLGMLTQYVDDLVQKHPLYREIVEKMDQLEREQREADEGRFSAFCEVDPGESLLAQDIQSVTQLLVAAGYSLRAALHNVISLVEHGNTNK